jgi:hypothetical protein
MSKVLDNRPELIIAFGGTEESLIINVCGNASEAIRQVIFIENYDTYTQMGRNDWIKSNEETILVYSSGFMASSSRIREKDKSIIHYATHSKLDENSKNLFELWFYREKIPSIKCFFFGDFDFSGISIFMLLRNIFPEMCIFALGYDAMLNNVKLGRGHMPMMAKKENQKDPGFVQDEYADVILLPAMRKYGFDDQEGVSYESLF